MSIVGGDWISFASKVADGLLDNVVELVLFREYGCWVGI